jgi:hypothetical protein
VTYVILEENDANIEPHGKNIIASAAKETKGFLIALCSLFIVTY